MNSNRVQYLAHEHKMPALQYLAAEYEKAFAIERERAASARFQKKLSNLQAWRDVGSKAFDVKEAPPPIEVARKRMAPRFHKLYTEHFLIAHGAWEDNSSSPNTPRSHSSTETWSLMGESTPIDDTVQISVAKKHHKLALGPEYEFPISPPSTVFPHSAKDESSASESSFADESSSTVCPSKALYASGIEHAVPFSAADLQSTGCTAASQEVQETLARNDILNYSAALPPTLSQVF